jgi:multiple sugar transport system permease protein
MRLPFSPRHLALVPISALMLLPLIWMFVTSVETLDQTRHFPPTLIPSGIHWSNYSEAWNQAPFGRFFTNSLIVTGTAVASNLLFCSLAGYAFARLRFFGREVLFIALLATLMVPFQVIMIPTFLIVQHLGLVDSLGGLIAPNLVTPFGIFLLRQFFRGIPRDLIDAARLDGLSTLGILRRIVLPLSRPALAALAILIGTTTWNDYFWPSIYLTNRSQMTLPVGLVSLQGQYKQGSPVVMFAAISLAVLPLLLVFLFAQRSITASLAMTGFK